MKKVYTIGRDLQNDIVLNDDSDVISRVHATIKFDGTKMYIIDQSQNGTYVNGMRMESNEEVPVSRNDTVSFANVYDLDWDKLPNPAKERMKLILIAFVSTLAVILIAWAVIHFTSQKTVEENCEQTTVVTSDADAPEADADVKEKEDSANVAETPSEKTNKGGSKPVGKKNDKAEETPQNDTEKEKPEIEKPEAGGDIPLY